MRVRERVRVRGRVRVRIRQKIRVRVRVRVREGEDQSEGVSQLLSVGFRAISRKLLAADVRDRPSRLTCVDDDTLSLCGCAHVHVREMCAVPGVQGR